MLFLKKRNLCVFKHNSFQCVYTPFCRALRGIFSSSGFLPTDLTQDVKFDIEDFWMKSINEISFDYNGKQKYYLLSMFPYPSGSLHMGHMRVYTISDAIARFQRMRGFNVIHPIGFDAFGLPAENAAVDRNIHPAEWTAKNIDVMRSQLKRLNLSFNWDMELTTCDPSYYKWTQYLFLLLYDCGLAYKKKAVVNWDPVDETVLADEQVDENGFSWRSGCKVEKRKLTQWFLRTTVFAEELYKGLDSPDLIEWRDAVKIQQHWIGNCCGYMLLLKVFVNGEETQELLPVWTDIPEQVYGATFVAISSANHFNSAEWGGDCSTSDIKLQIQVCHPVTRALLPVFVSDFLNHSPATDSFLGIPGNLDKNCFHFAMKHQIPIINTVDSSGNLLNSEEFTGMNVKDAKGKIIEKIKQKGVTIYCTSRTLRDWLVSRQRYWGTPIPIIYCTTCKVVPVPKENLPVILPLLKTTSGKKNCLKSSEDWISVKCPRCGKNAIRETDTLDTFVDSSWYFLRYLDVSNALEPFNAEKVKYFMPVDLYIGGKEHAALHLFYARFMCHFLYSLDMLKTREPFQQLLMQGMILGQSYKNCKTGKFITKNEVDFSGLNLTDKETGDNVVAEWEKMSKSKLNGTDPEDVVQKYGIDTTRLFILGSVAPQSPRKWTDELFPGILNWQNRIWLTVIDFFREKKKQKNLTLNTTELLDYESHLFDAKNFYIKGVTRSFVTTRQLNVTISKLQGLTSELRKVPKDLVAVSDVYEDTLAMLIIMLAPLAPHFASELWAIFSSVAATSKNYNLAQPVLQQKWPRIDANYPLELKIKLNGKEVDSFSLPQLVLHKLTKDEATTIVMKREKVLDILKNSKIKKVLYKQWQDYDTEINIIFIPDKKEIKNKKTEKAF